MKIATFLFLALVLACAPASAEDVLTIGDQTDVPLEHISSVGEFVQGYVNGHGPFWFEINLGGPTRLTVAVIKATGVKLKSDRVVTSEFSGAIMEEAKADAVDIRIGDTTIKANPIAISDRSLSAYAPIENYGGNIGAEILQNGVLTIDIAHKKLILSSHGEDYEAAGEISLPLSMVDGHNSVLTPTLELTVDGQTSDLYLSSHLNGVDFTESSETGDAVFAKTPYDYKTLNWSPDSVTKGELGLMTDAMIGDVPLGSRHVYRDASAAPLPPRVGLNKRNRYGRRPAEAHLIPSANDGTIGFESLGSPFVRVDSASQRIWLKARAGDAAKGHVPPKLETYSTIGFTPWPYRDRVVVRSLVLGSPADLAGLRPGDEILSLNDGDIYRYYKDLNSGPADRQTKVVFRNRSGEHTVLLTPAAPKG